MQQSQGQLIPLTQNVQVTGQVLEPIAKGHKEGEIDETEETTDGRG